MAFKNADGLIFQSELSKEMHRKFLGYSEENIKSTIIFNVDINRVIFT